MESSCWTYPDSEEFKKAKEAKALCFELTKKVRSTLLDADIEAMVADAKNQQHEKEVYYSNGKIRSDQEVMTDPIIAEFDEIKSINKALLYDYKILSKISDIKKEKELELIKDQFKHLENKIEQKTSNEFAIVLDDIRDQCEEQLWETIQDIAMVHEQDNENIIENLKVRLENELLPLNEKYQNVQASYDQISMEYEKVKLDALQSYTILKKHNLLPSNMRFSFTEDDEVKLMDTLKGYQVAITEKDDMIINLKKQIAKLEASDPASNSKRNSNNRQTSLGRPSVAHIGRKSIAVRKSIADSSYEEKEEDAPDYSQADNLEKKYLLEIETLKAENQKELLSLQEKEQKIAQDWHIKTRAAANLQINTKLQKVVERQNRILNLATKARPRPDCDKEVSAYISGTTLRQMDIFQLKNIINDTPLSSETQAFVDDTMKVKLSTVNQTDDEPPAPIMLSETTSGISRTSKDSKRDRHSILIRRNSSFKRQV